MANRVELIFDIVSPNAYMVWKPLRDIVQRTGAELDITPVFLGGMHKLTGNAPPFMRDAEIKGKNEYAMLEMRRFIEKHQLNRYKMAKGFPFNSILIQRACYAADQDGRGVQFVEAMLRGVWEDGIDATDSQAVMGVLAEAGFDAEDIAARIQTDEVKQGLIDNTANAVERGTFGIPTMYTGPKDGPQEMFFGKERLGQIEEELAKG